MNNHTGCFLLSLFSIILLAIVIAAGAQAQMPALNVPQKPDALSIIRFIGQPAVPNAVEAPAIPRNPFMAQNGKSNTHNDSYMSDTYVTGGPLGRSPQVKSSSLGGDCVTMAFDRAGRIVTACLGLTTARLFLIDPGREQLELATLAYLDLPAQTRKLGEFSAGGYFYLDNHDHVLIPTIERTIWEVAEVSVSNRPVFRRVRTYDLKRYVPPDDSIGSVLPDFSERLWFVSKGGVVGTISQNRMKVATLRLDQEEIGNSFAIDKTGGVFIASDHALYRFDAGKAGEPVITWREAYDRGSRQKPGQIEIGTGTTPTLMGSDLVAIADNADPRMHVLVYRRGPNVSGSRLVCSEPVFAEGMGATENSLIATDRSIIVENNFGYSGPGATMYGLSTEPGITRIDLDEGGGCHTVWTSMERVPNAVSKMSLENGLIYTYTKEPDTEKNDAWYFTAIDFRTGETVFKQAAGTGYCYNSHYAGLYLGPDKTAYVGLLNGLVAIRDGQ